MKLGFTLPVSKRSNWNYKHALVTLPNEFKVANELELDVLANMSILRLMKNPYKKAKIVKSLRFIRLNSRWMQQKIYAERLLRRVNIDKYVMRRMLQNTLLSKSPAVNIWGDKALRMYGIPPAEYVEAVLVLSTKYNIPSHILHNYLLPFV